MTSHDATLEVSNELLQKVIKNNGFHCTINLEENKKCNFYVVAIPILVDSDYHLDLRPLWRVSEIVGKVISKGDVAVNESIVYLGVTEE